MQNVYPYSYVCYRLIRFVDIVYTFIFAFRALHRLRVKSGFLYKAKLREETDLVKRRYSSEQSLSVDVSFLVEVGKCICWKN